MVTGILTTYASPSGTFPALAQGRVSQIPVLLPFRAG